MTVPAALLIAWIRAYAVLYGVDEADALAVARVESGCVGQEFRLGALGRQGIYAGPFGLHRAYCREHFGVDPLDPETNIRLGVAALRPRRGESTLRAALQRYNTSFNAGYWRAVQQARRQYRMSGKEPGQ